MPALDDLHAQAVNAAQLASATGGSMLPQAQAASVPTPPPAAEKPEAAAEPAPAHDAPPAVEAASSPFTAPSDADKALLEDLRNRRSSIESREQTMSERAAGLAAAEKRLADRVNELTELQLRLQGLEKDLKDHDEANWQGMVKTYETMRPREAATIFNALDKPVLIEVLDRMKPAKAAPVLAAMDTEKARQVTADLATRRTRATTLSN